MGDANSDDIASIILDITRSRTSAVNAVRDIQASFTLTVEEKQLIYNMYLNELEIIRTYVSSLIVK